MLHHTIGGNIIQDVYDKIMSLADPEIKRSRVDVEQVTDVFRTFNFHLVSHKQQKECGSNLLLFRHKPTNVITKYQLFEVPTGNLNWVEKLKKLLDTSDDDVILIARENLNGLEEFCESLRRETGSDRVRCISNRSLDAASQLPDDLSEVIARHHVANVYHGGKWGNFHLVDMKEIEQVDSSRSYLLSTNPGDLSSLKWFRLPSSKNSIEYKVKFAALNFRDVMLASGKLPAEAIPGETDKYRTLLGLEFSGFDHVGTRTMGIVPGEGFSTHVTQDERFTWIVPEQWSLAEAATVPVVYSTAYYALVVRGRIREGEIVLIHCGAGGVGQAAISIALSRGCKVFTTVSSQAKRTFLKQKFKQLDDASFTQSRDLSFEREIMRKTNGKGVDVVLNSLSGEKLIASVRCLAKHGRFLELGKFDLIHDNKIGLSAFLKNISFHGILLDSLFGDVTESWMEVRELVREGIEKGEVKPLPHRIFQKKEVESAFRFMSHGTHIGKVLVDVIRETDHVLQRISLNPDLCYVITGGLGGFGMEVCDWLVQRGARKLLITSKSGVKTAYRQRHIDVWASQGVHVTVSDNDVSKADEAAELLDERTGGIFHLAMTLRDAMFHNQTQRDFELVWRPKCDGIINLDKFTRQKCPNLDYFVTFSSIASYNGTKGQSNYVLANSVMEQLCRIRHNDGLPGVAIQWGAVGDVGIAADRFGESPVAGTWPQSIQSCLDNLDKLLQRDEPIVASYIPVEKLSRKRKTDRGISPETLVANILGIADWRKVDANLSMLRLGADSLMTTEILQKLNHCCGVTMDTKAVTELTFAKLKGIARKSTKVAPQYRKFQRLRSSTQSISVDFRNVSSSSCEFILE
uniref:Fatty acid synthase n=1 Tax=Phallusia mammillata TaxID=59560 RepID=A0A6F9DCV3_9ASCI|nr:fatty acid synthase [Phallusia mammillata]